MTIHKKNCFRVLLFLCETQEVQLPAVSLIVMMVDAEVLPQILKPRQV